MQEISSEEFNKRRKLLGEVRYINLTRTGTENNKL